MSVYKPKGSPFYQYDFQFRGNRFHGTTRKTSRREAEAVERHEREQIKQQATAKISTSTCRLQLDQVASRFWQEVGQHHSGSDDTWRDISRIVEYFGATRLLTEITNNDVARFVAWRRGHRVVRKDKSKVVPFICNATVNRSTTEVLKKLFTRAKKGWGISFKQEPNWKEHILPEPQERIRELVGDEEQRLEDATRSDYLPFFAFTKASGLRLKECLLHWSEVDWNAQQIRKHGKGGKLVTVPITPTIRNILFPLQGHHPDYVFTYVAIRTRDHHIKGQRYPITHSGLNYVWQRLRKNAGVVGFRFHDFRHSFATSLLRETGNLKLVQKALNHSDIKTTLRYAHVLDSEVADAMEKVQAKKRTVQAKCPEAKSRSDVREAG
jgi:integrase